MKSEPVWVVGRRSGLWTLYGDVETCARERAGKALVDRDHRWACPRDGQNKGQAQRVAKGSKGKEVKEATSGSASIRTMRPAS